MDPAEAVADAWASMNGKLEAFRAEKADPARDHPGGYFVGFFRDAQELLRRVEARGYVLVQKPAGD